MWKPRFVDDPERLLAYLAPAVTLLALRGLLPDNFCDDAYISFRVARNLALGEGLGYNPGDHVYVSTTPLWVLLLAATRNVVGDVVLAARLLGTACELLLVATLVRFGSRLSQGPLAGMFAALFLIANPVYLLTSVSGMELSLYLLVVVSAAECAFTSRWTSALVLAALCVWIRIDGVVVLGGLLVTMLIARRTEFGQDPATLARCMLFPTLICFAYLVFGGYFFDTWLPMSVQRKALLVPPLLSEDWRNGFGVLLEEFAKTLIGRSAYWYEHPTPLVFAVMVALVGAWRLISLKERRLLALLVVTVLYVASVLGSGCGDARNFPWYFVPVLPLVYLCAGVGLVWLASCLLERLFTRRPTLVRLAASLIGVGAWLLVSYGPIAADAGALQFGRVGVQQRERAYATLAVWIGEQMGEAVTVAAHEIGALGFFLPPRASVLDTFGILREPGQLRTPYLELIRSERPEFFVSRTHFGERRKVEAALPGMYRWRVFRTVLVGVRNDIAPSLRFSESELRRIEEALVMSREYPW